MAVQECVDRSAGVLEASAEAPWLSLFLEAGRKPIRRGDDFMDAPQCALIK